MVVNVAECAAVLLHCFIEAVAHLFFSILLHPIKADVTVTAGNIYATESYSRDSGSGSF